jgi:hypothetical protein
MKSRRMYVLKITRDEFEKNPRISVVQLHKKVREIAGVKMRNTTRRYISWGFENEIIGPPRPVLKYHTNLHRHVYFRDGDLLDFENIVSDENDIRYACALSGSSDCIMFTTFSPKGKDLLFQAYTRADGYNKDERFSLEKLKFSHKEEPESLNINPNILDWDEVDWKLFEILSPDVRIKYSDISKQIGLEWRTIKTRFENKILPSCDIATYLFPNGQHRYQQLYLYFKTDFIGNFIRRLNYMQTTTYFLAFEKNTVGIFMFPENMNNILKVFKKLEKEGIIDDFRHFLPLTWYHIAELGWPRASTWSSATQRI